IVGRQFGIDRLVVGLRLGVGGALGLRPRFRVRRLGIRLVARVFLFALLFAGRLAVRFLGRRFAHRDAVAKPEHNDNGVRLLGGENALGRGRPVGGLALGLIFDQAGDGLVFTDHPHIGLLRIGIFKAV